jgi:hypothetical protein
MTTDGGTGMTHCDLVALGLVKGVITVNEFRSYVSQKTFPLLQNGNVFLQEFNAASRTKVADTSLSAMK